MNENHTPDTNEVVESNNENVIVESMIDAAEAVSENEEFQMNLDYADEREAEDLNWKEATGLDEESLCGAIETIVFLSDRPVTVNKIRDNISKTLPLRVIYESLSRLQEEYEAKHHGIRLFELGEGYQFKTKAMFSKYVQDLFKAGSITLSSTALEVLAIVAYKQPVSRIEVEKIRGVDSSHILRNLMDKRLVKVEGRSDELGRPSTYVTTVEFLEMFNIKCLEDLPPEIELEALANQKEVGEIKDIKSLVSKTEEMKEKFTFDEIDELDALAGEIKEIPTDTEFTKTWKAEDKKKKNPETKDEAKSAFDLIEDFVFNPENPEVDGINGIQEDTLSEEDRETIRDLKQNVPEFQQEDESEIEEALEEAKELALMDFQDEVAQISEEINDSQEEEENELELALDQAFERLMGDSDDSPEENTEVIEITSETDNNFTEESAASDDSETPLQ